jgi:superfamily II DNA or RNA helicase
MLHRTKIAWLSKTMHRHRTNLWASQMINFTTFGKVIAYAKCTQNKMDIHMFYPKYPFIHPYQDETLNPYRGQTFDDAIVSKKELADLKLDRIEQFPDKPGALFNHQLYISRFFASTTDYNELLLFHEPGTGKTCTAIAAIESLRKDNSSNIKGALIFSKGEGLLKNFLQELIFTCTDGRYIPKDYESLTELQKVHRVRKIASEFYQFHTFETFAKDLAKLSDGQIRNRYEDSIVVIDEVHNLREHDEKDVDPEESVTRAHSGSVYRQFYRMCHVLTRRKILLMSGTPIKDAPEEFASVMNLILPVSLQFVTDKAFVKRYFDTEGELKPDTRAEMANKIRGRISYLNAATTDVKKRYIGRTIGNLKHFIVSEDVMSPFQSKAYAIAYAEDEKSHSIFNNSRQASLFVFPDGSVGAAGFNKYVVKRTTHQRVLGKTKGKGQTTYEISAALSKEITDLSSLQKYSSKYAAVIRILDKKSTHFVYCQYVNGSGAIVFAGILEKFGYQRATGNERSKGLRYILATNQTASSKSIQRMINRFNADDNIDGEYISVVIGSRVLNEGFTLKNIRHEFILTGHWNYAETAQAIARGWRLGSHNAMIARGDADIAVNVYQCVSIPDKSVNVPSVDLDMYVTAEKKDVTSRQIERLVKESAFDCPLTIARNKVLGYDGQRECDYVNCDYVCDGMIGQLDTSTYDINASVQANVARSIREYLREKMRRTQSLSVSVVRDAFPNISEFELAQALKLLIDTDSLYLDRYGFYNFLRIQGDSLYLSLEPKAIEKADVSLSKYYSANFVIENGDSFTRVLNELYDASLPARIQTIFDQPDIAQTLIITLPPKVQREILQGCIIAQDENKDAYAALRKELLDFYSGFYDKIDVDGQETWVVWLYSDDIGTTCYDSDTRKFIQCDVSDRKRVKHSEMKASPIGYYGLYNPELNDFCLRDVQQARQEDLRKLTVGRRCINFDSDTLIDVIARRMMIEPPATYLHNWSSSRIETAYANLKKYTRASDLKNVDAMKRVLYWQSQTKNQTCDAMKEWFKQHGLLEKNFDCGTQKKSRAKFR